MSAAKGKFGKVEGIFVERVKEMANVHERSGRRMKGKTESRVYESRE